MEFNSDQVIEAVTKALSDTFEGLAFAQVFDYQKLTEAPDLGERLASYIVLPDPINLRVLLALSKEHLTECLDAAAGGLDDVSDEVLHDFLKEIVNTWAGHIFTLLAPGTDSMTIGLPHWVEGEELKSRTTPGDNRVVLRYEVEEHIVFAKVTSSKED
jgi:hypothetical protein